MTTPKSSRVGRASASSRSSSFAAFFFAGLAATALVAAGEVATGGAEVAATGAEGATVGGGACRTGMAGVSASCARLALSACSLSACSFLLSSSYEVSPFRATVAAVGAASVMNLRPFV